MESPTKVYADKKMWFSMWFLGAIVTFGAAFFPMYHRLVQGTNKHFQHDSEWQEQIAAYLKRNGKAPPALTSGVPARNAKIWAASIILIIPSFILLYLLSKDLSMHEQKQDIFLSAAFPERIFMPQTIPIKTYVLISIVTLGVGGVYWLYKVVNLYNAHFKAQSLVEKEIGRLMEDQEVVG